MAGRDTADETKEAIMRATYRALCEHGGANLTMQAIADEFDKTKAVLHYHYDTKENLLVAFLEYLLDQFDPEADGADLGTPEERLLAVLQALLGMQDPTGADGFDHEQLSTALLQIRAQAPYDPEFRRQLTVNVSTVRDRMVEIIEDGIDQGVFRSVDPEQTAMTLLAATTGARNYEVTLDVDDVEADVDAVLEAIVHEWLCEPEAE